MAFVKNAVMAVRDGRTINNDQLLQEIRVPDKIQRAVKVNTGRPPPEYEHHQLNSERLFQPSPLRKGAAGAGLDAAYKKKPFVVPPLAPAEDKRRANTFRSNMMRTGNFKRPRDYNKV